MDELKLETGFMRKLIGRLLEKTIEKHYGYSVKIKLGTFHATVVNGTAHVELSAEAEMDANQLTKIIG